MTNEKQNALVVNMKASNGPRAIGGSITESKESRESRMLAYWSDRSNAVLIVVGYLLAVVHNGKTLAQWLTEGAEFPMEKIGIGDKSFPLVDGFMLSLKSLNVWGCPACHSAHGSGVYPSREVKAKLLARNKFYYNPSTRQLLTISDTCWSVYVVDLAATKHIVAVDKYRAPATVPAK